jgi:hypothetical protein
LIDKDGKKYVLRKKPPGQLLSKVRRSIPSIIFAAES